MVTGGAQKNPGLQGWCHLSFWILPLLSFDFLFGLNLWPSDWNVSVCCSPADSAGGHEKLCQEQKETIDLVNQSLDFSDFLQTVP